MKRWVLTFVVLMVLWGCGAKGENPKEAPSLPVIPILRKDDIRSWSELEEGMAPRAAFPDSKSDLVVSHLTPEALWSNQQMQLAGIGWDPGEWLSLYGLMLVQDGEVITFPNESGLLGYSIMQVYLADLNGDGIYEVYTNSWAGSGMIHGFVQCYDPPSGSFYSLEKRFEEDFQCVVYGDSLYVRGNDLYQLVLGEGGLEYQVVPEEARDGITG